MADPEVAVGGPPAHLLHWDGTPARQLGSARYGSGRRGGGGWAEVQRPHETHLGEPSGKRGKEPFPPHTLVWGLPIHTHRNFSL